jgi:hypothetical protein
MTVVDVSVIFSGKWVDFLGRKKRGENGCARTVLLEFGLFS